MLEKNETQLESMESVLWWKGRRTMGKGFVEKISYERLVEERRIDGW